MSRVHWRQTAQKRRKKMGSSVVYKTRGTFLSQNKRHEDACGAGGAGADSNRGPAAVAEPHAMCKHSLPGKQLMTYYTWTGT